MTQFKFEFEKTYKEVDVAGELYKIEFNDEALTKYKKSIKRFDNGIKEATESIKDLDTATDEMFEETAAKQKAVVKDIVETFLGEGTFEGLYEKAGRAVKNLMDLVYYLIEIYVEENQKKTEQTREKYLANVKQ